MNEMKETSAVMAFVERSKRDLFFRISMLLCLVALFLMLLLPEPWRTWSFYFADVVLAMCVIATLRLLRKAKTVDEEKMPAWVPAMDVADKFFGMILLVLAVVIIAMKTGVLQ